MPNKWISSLILGLLLVFCSGSDVQGALIKGGFIPVTNSKTVLSESQVKYHQVKKGDTLWDIARKYQVDLNTIMAMNNLNKNSVLHIGQTIQIPYNSRARVHTIAKGETMWDISQKYDVDVHQLIRANPTKNPNNLKIGDQLEIPDSSNSSSRIVLAYNEPSRSYTNVKSQFMWPVVGTITSRYGWRSSGFHHGIDIAGDLGDPVKAAAAGKVAFADYKAVYGRTVILQHPDGYETWYAHLQNIKVKVGSQVAKGQVIGTIGTTGRTTGPHLHFEVRKGSTNYDPLNYLRH
ncbi:MAG: M23 family metallopeptidase [Syntrophomonadaceae bacterium]|nr:M23 family metallopeptidase [Syntrophomonadaceae bacterium]